MTYTVSNPRGECADWLVTDKSGQVIAGCTYEMDAHKIVKALNEYEERRDG